ncbi:G kinase-anchoring protein 1-like [Onthophagus taurus]|uniref:G kinase-anchoring protein 1-like n=1 Tax=Onthophagus taurus TaxID=166361 RepID=UPI0039BDE59E
MSNIAVPSRFACLKIEGDEERPKKNDRKSVKSKKTDKPQSENKKINKPEKVENKIEKQQVVISKKEKKGEIAPQKQWEEWKQKDSEFVNGSYQKDLENAILLSKLDYEEKKTLYEAAAVITEPNKKMEKKKKGTKTISLDKFLVEPEQSKNEVNLKSSDSKIETDLNFFDKVRSDMVLELNKEKLIENRKNRNANIEKVITASQYQERLKLELDKNDELDKEVVLLKVELADVKSRNEELIKILEEGDLKEKADILLELDRLSTIKNDLMEEVTKLHTLLEIERSKVASLTAEIQKNKDKKSKKHS